MKHFWWILFLPALSFASGPTEDESRFAEEMKKICGLDIKVDLHDYSYGRDEQSRYSNLDFDPTSNMFYILKGACEANPDNKGRLGRISVFTVKRGNFGIIKLIMRKTGELVFLAGRDPKVDLQDWLKAEFTKLFKFDYERPEQKKAKVEEAKKKEDDKAIEIKREADGAVQQKKIAELTTWFQGEVKKITANPADPEMSKKLEALSQTYKDKLNALTTR